MNVPINSQVQSPFVRTLEAVPTKGGSFTHHIPDNVPPVSISKVEVDPVSAATKAGAAEVITFNVPQYGYLTKAVVRVKVTYEGDIAGTTGSSTWAPPVIAGDGVLSMVNNASLNTRNRPIEKRYGQQMFADILSGDDSERKRKLELLEWHYDTVVATGAGTVENLPGRRVNSETDFATAASTVGTESAGTMFPGVKISDIEGAATKLKGTYYSYLELPFSSFETLASNYNTRFVEPMSVKLDLRSFATAGDSFRVRDAVIAAGGSWTGVTTDSTAGWQLSEVKLICHFVNYHDLTEQDIRDANFKPDAPAIVFATDVREETCVDTGASPEGTDVKVDIRSNNIARELMVLYTPLVHYGSVGALPAQAFNGGWSRHNQFLCVDTVKLTGSGQTLYEGSSVENILIDRYDHPLSTWSNKLYNAYGTNDDRGLDGVHLIQFGLTQNPTYNSGCLGLQTVSSPQITVSLNALAAASPRGEIRVFVKHHSLVQIDSGSGAITRSIDS